MIQIIIIIIMIIIIIIIILLDRLCGLVVRVPGDRSRGPGFDSRRYLENRDYGRGDPLRWPCDTL
jgi:hypothetical protein